MLDNEGIWLQEPYKKFSYSKQIEANKTPDSQKL